MKTIIAIFFLFPFAITTSKSKNLLIGDSQTPSIACHSKLTEVEHSLQKGGWRVSDLIIALKSHNIATNTETVFVCIGTNGMFSKEDDVDGLCNLLKEKFPNARHYVIPGSFGWSWKGSYTPPLNMQNRVDDYYLRFEKNGVKKLKNGIGLSKTHPDNTTPSMKLIAQEIDLLIQNK